MIRGLLVAVCVGLVIPVCVQGAEFKMGYVNATQIFEQYSVAKEAQAAYEKEMTDLNKQVSDLEAELQSISDSLEARKYLFSEERLKEKRADLEKKQADYIKFRQDAELKAAKRNEELTKPIVQAIEKAAKGVAEKEGFDLVLDASAGIVVYSKPDLDLTDKVLQALEQAKQAGETGQQPSTTGGGQ